MRHRHQYVEVARYFQPPPNREVNVRGSLDMDRFAFGFTSVELKCDECGQVEVHEFNGKVGV